ncbi:MAG: hypothetical protein KJZ86_23270 [Caldilineaceae bacterium]|nr:hypothetical protein [Caldilineaceae bacterium]
MTPTQPELLREEAATYSTDGPVTCLGMTFPDEAARRAYFSERLREHLQDPEFRAIEGFPVGDDEAILALSDPPYYTACPNPFLPEIIADWTVRRTVSPTSRANSPTYKREPFAADVSEGKNDPIYNAHSYHTKVPHKAIMRYILHYTEPGDIVFDGFCGTGMTGVAAQLCGDRAVVESLFPVRRTVSPTETSRTNSPTYRIGARRAILNDLSPAATFIAYNYNTPVDAGGFEREAKRILREVERELGWMYETLHTDGKTKGRINYTVWSEVFACPSCGGEVVFVDEALDPETKRVRDEFACPSCGAMLGKRSVERHFETIYDEPLQTTYQRVKFVPSFVNYKVRAGRVEKSPNGSDQTTLSRIDELGFPAGFPTNSFPIAQMYHGSRLEPKGFTRVHHLFLPRARHALSALWRKANGVADERLRAMVLFAVEQAIWGMSLLNRYQPIQFGRTGGSQVNRFLSGVYYVGSQIAEVSPWYILDGKTKRLHKAFAGLQTRRDGTAITTQSATALRLPPNSIDYIFTDPPFGENIYYADLNFLVESWHGVLSNSEPEAIIDRAKRKALADYQELMRATFQRYFEALKPGRWMTVEFHNSHDTVWKAIQEGLMSVGFVVADVRTLDKQQASYRQVTAASAAKQDLVISAYKPTDDFRQRFLSHAGTAEGVWEFVRQHLAQVPVVVSDSHGQLETIAERQNFLLFDRMVAYHIQRGVAVPMGAAQFYAGLERAFVPRDGMYFLPDQVAAYDKARLEAAGVAQLVLFVSDEKSALHWLRQQLAEQPHSFQEIQPRFLRELHQARHEELPDLRVLLEENFLQDEAGRWYVPDPNRAEDLEKLRLKGLLREFETYKTGKKKLRQFRTEAMRAGFAAAWRAREYGVIVEVAERLPEQVLQEDEELVMYYDNARNRV